MKYIDADKLIAEIERRLYFDNNWIEGDERRQMRTNSVSSAYYKRIGSKHACENILDFITSLQQEQLETEMKSPFTGGKVAILSRQEEATFRGENVKILRKYYHCEDTGREFTDSKLDDDMMWAAFRAYCEKKGVTSFTDIMLKQEQPEY